MQIIGLMSGTSVDSIDAALVEVQGQGYDLTVQVLASTFLDYPEALRSQILQVCGGQPLPVAVLADLDDQIAHQFAIAAQTLIAAHGPADLIASHGQTIFHRPCSASQGSPLPLARSIQLGRGAVIAGLTDCPTVSNFRAADIAAGGEGAPLVPPVDLALLSHDHHYRCVQNIGGIGNVTALPPRSAQEACQGAAMAAMGWDTGPGNSLIDIAVHHFSQGDLAFDRDGQWSAQGTICEPLLARWLTHPYFQQKPPKSTGRETFGWDFFQRCMQQAAADDLSAADVLATLTELTVVSIAQSYEQFLHCLPDEVLICGGGSRNRYLMTRLQQQWPQIPVKPTDAAGIPSDLKEAIAFAVLGFWHHQGWPGNLTAVTGAQRPAVLGEMAWPQKPR